MTKGIQLEADRAEEYTALGFCEEIMTTPNQHTFLTVVGARPQFVKAAVISRAVRLRQQQDAAYPVREILVHTGQHYDANMSQVFFDEMDIPRPDYHLEVGSGTHGVQTGTMLAKLEEVMMRERPEIVLVYGDTNSTLAGALAAAKLHIPVAHVEAGLRSFNRRMPEEINRVMADHLSRVLFCPTAVAVENLRAEGLQAGGRGGIEVVTTGDVMYDATLFYGEKAKGRTPLARFGVSDKQYLLATIHRAESTDDPATLTGILNALAEIGQRYAPIVWPVHPRTRHLLQSRADLRAEWLDRPRPYLHLVEPLGFFDMIAAERGARLILTDSGGVQKEAYFHAVPCVTLRTETEWVELVDAGWNRVAGINPNSIIDAVAASMAIDWQGLPRPTLYGTGRAGEVVVDWLSAYLSDRPVTPGHERESTP